MLAKAAEDQQDGAVSESKVVLLDVDGTIVDYHTELPPSAAVAIKAARANGHRIYMCTGRAKAEIYPYLWEIGFDGYIGGNGAFVEDDGVTVVDRALAEDVCHRAVAWLVANDFGFYLEANSGLYGSDNLPERMAPVIGGPVAEAIERVKTKGFPHMIYGTTQGRPDVFKISFVLEEGVDLEQLAQEYAGEAKIGTWTLTGKGPEFGEFGQLGVDKGVAVRALGEHLGVSPDDMIAFGDSNADNELFATCGTTVAMGNGSDAIKAAATFVTDAVMDDGLYNAFVRLGLIEAG
ncbi:MAG TPA: Cof-type HAD-IIB family hydrolase [Propionibacteriaceae bacterium]|nr:Cof-type HAD-IIB family hydrolase [Propionibacteriaceae bacterium]HBY24302.1 Cof-type HAD-IIB family hydrolase [Propionibacteriaceae bacterium]